MAGGHPVLGAHCHVGAWERENTAGWGDAGVPVTSRPGDPPDPMAQTPPPQGRGSWMTCLISQLTPSFSARPPRNEICREDVQSAGPLCACWPPPRPKDCGSCLTLPAQLANSLNRLGSSAQEKWRPGKESKAPGMKSCARSTPPTPPAPSMGAPKEQWRDGQGRTYSPCAAPA